MLNVMRDNLRSLRWVLWLVAASMVLYLGAFFSCDDQAPGVASGDWAALVAGSPISASSFRQSARRLDDQYRGTFGEQYDSIRPNLRIGSRAINDLIVNELIRHDAERMGLTVGAAEVADTIRNDPSLQQDGVFVGSEVYERAVEGNFPGGVPAFEKAIGQDLITRKWYDVMTQSVRINPAELESVHRRRTEKTAIDYVMLKKAEQTVDPSFPDDQVRAWYDSHQDDYMRDPGRSIRYMELTRTQLEATVGVTEDEIRASYEANLATYSHGDQRRASHILLRLDPGADDARKAEVRASAESILARLQAGEPFEPLAQTLSEDPISAGRGGDLDFFERERMVPEFAEAAFSTDVGQLTALTETQFGFHIIKVTDARPAGTSSLDQVRDEIEARLVARSTQEKAASEAERIAARVRSGESFEGVASAEGFEAVDFFVARGDSLTELGVIRPDAVDQIFALGVGDTSAPLDTRGGKIIVTVDAITSAEVAPFDEVENEVRLDMLDDRRLTAAYDVATRAAAGDWTVQSVAGMLDLEVQESTDLGPGTSPPDSGGNSEELQQALFGDSVAVGGKGVARVPDGALMYSVTRREPFDPVAFESARTELTQELETNRKSAQIESILTKLRERYEVEINQELVGQIDGVR
jgi:peptidyl-prolyl cis-trans isomerase D